MTTNYNFTDSCEKYSDPYEGYKTIDDTPHPLSHGQFLANLAGEEDFDLIWRLGEGDESALNELDNWQVKERATGIFNRLVAMNYWERFS